MLRLSLCIQIEYRYTYEEDEEDHGVLVARQLPAHQLVKRNVLRRRRTLKSV